MHTRVSEMGSCEFCNIKLASKENGKCLAQRSNYNFFGKINEYTTQMRITGKEYRLIVRKYSRHRARRPWEGETQLHQGSQTIRRKEVFCFHERNGSLQVTFQDTRVITNFK